MQSNSLSSLLFLKFNWLSQVHVYRYSTNQFRDFFEKKALEREKNVSVYFQLIFPHRTTTIPVTWYIDIRKALPAVNAYPLHDSIRGEAIFRQTQTQHLTRFRGKVATLKSCLNKKQDCKCLRLSCADRGYTWRSICLVISRSRGRSGELNVKCILMKSRFVHLFRWKLMSASIDAFPWFVSCPGPAVNLLALMKLPRQAYRGDYFVAASL